MVNVVVVTGANSGLGAAICSGLDQTGSSLLLKVVGPESEVSGRWEMSADLSDEAACADVASWVKACTKELLEDLCFKDDEKIYPILINCAGINYIDWFENADFAMFDKLIGLNVKAGLMLAQQLIGKRPPAGGQEDDNWFRGRGAILNIVSNASHMPMTNSAFYNASKGAFHIATLALARELRKTHGICVFGISPNKLAGTAMSAYIEGQVPSLRGWTPEQAATYQLGALPSGEETDPATLAEFIAFLLYEPQRHKYLTNTIIPYGA
jgi:NAD(P)-dependent dehydrogenase (short-subunit alcohol dehydrogenase family)